MKGIGGYGFDFAIRPRPYPADLRSDWRITAVLLAISHCRSKRASVPQLHVLVWAMMSDVNGEQLASALVGETSEPVPARFDPAVARAIDRGVALGLIERQNGRLVLSGDGTAWLSAVISNEELLANERARMEAIGVVSMKAIDAVTGSQ